MTLGVRSVFAALIVICSVAPAEEDSIYDRIWDYTALYANEENPAVQDFVLSGRIQADATIFDADAGRYRDVEWRRFRFGFKSLVFRDFLVHAETSLGLNELDFSGPESAYYDGLTDSYVGWYPGEAFRLKVGKQSAPFTLDGATSSTRLITLERSIVADNLWFSQEYFTGVAGFGSKDDWTYRAGVYSASSDKEFGHLDSGGFGLISLGRDFEAASVRLDYVYNDPDYSGEVGSADLRHFFSLVSKSRKGKLGLWTDLSFGKGIGSQSDLVGLQLMPFYDLTEQWQVVFRYAAVASTDDPGVRLARYPSRIEPGLAETAHDFFLGLNWFLYDHKLKWQSGVEYNHATDIDGTGGDYNGWGLTTGIRAYW